MLIELDLAKEYAQGQVEHNIEQRQRSSWQLRSCEESLIPTNMISGPAFTFSTGYVLSEGAGQYGNTKG